jgi:hypothetical protein
MNGPFEPTGRPSIDDVIKDLRNKGCNAHGVPRTRKHANHGRPILRDLQQPSAANPRRGLNEMSQAEIEKYLATAGQATQLIMAARSRYCLVIASPGGRVDYVTTLEEKLAAAVLRDLAKHIDPAVAEGWSAVDGPVPEQAADEG